MTCIFFLAFQMGLSRAGRGNGHNQDYEAISPHLDNSARYSLKSLKLKLIQVILISYR